VTAVKVQGVVLGPPTVVTRNDSVKALMYEMTTTQYGPCVVTMVPKISFQVIWLKIGSICILPVLYSAGYEHLFTPTGMKNTVSFLQWTFSFWLDGLYGLRKTTILEP